MTRNKNTQDLLYFKAISNFNKYNIKLNIADKEDISNNWKIILSILK